MKFSWRCASEYRVDFEYFVQISKIQNMETKNNQFFCDHILEPPLEYYLNRTKTFQRFLDSPKENLLRNEKY